MSLLGTISKSKPRSGPRLAVFERWVRVRDMIDAKVGVVPGQIPSMTVMHMLRHIETPKPLLDVLAAIEARDGDLSDPEFQFEVMWQAPNAKHPLYKASLRELWKQAAEALTGEQPMSLDEVWGHLCRRRNSDDEEEIETILQRLIAEKAISEAMQEALQSVDEDSSTTDSDEEDDETDDDRDFIVPDEVVDVVERTRQVWLRLMETHEVTEAEQLAKRLEALHVAYRLPFEGVLVVNDDEEESRKRPREEEPEGRPRRAAAARARARLSEFTKDEDSDEEQAPDDSDEDEPDSDEEDSDDDYDDEDDEDGASSGDDDVAKWLPWCYSAIDDLIKTAAAEEPPTAATEEPPTAATEAHTGTPPVAPEADFGVDASAGDVWPEPEF